MKLYRGNGNLVKLVQRHSKKIFALVIALQIVLIYVLISPGTTINLQEIELDEENIKDLNNTYLDLDHFYKLESGYSETWETHYTYNVTVKTIFNKQGLRNKENYSFEKPDETFRIGFFGDSYTYGLGVNHTDRWTNNLENRLNRELKCEEEFQGINFGVPGYDTNYAVEMYLQEGNRYDNNLNVFYFTDNDVNFIDDLYEDKREKILESHSVEDISNLPEDEREEIEQKIDRAYNEKITSISDEELRDKQIITPLQELSHNIEEPENVLIFTSHISDENNEYFRETAEEQGFRFTTLNSLGNRYESYWNDFSYEENLDGSHSNPRGHRFISDYLYLYLISNNLVECN